MARAAGYFLTLFHSFGMRLDPGAVPPRLGAWSLGFGAFLLAHPTFAAAPLPADHAERMTRGLVTFTQHVRPVLVKSCLGCHGEEKTKGGLDLATREDLLKGGTEGAAIMPFSAKDSRLLKLLRHAEEPHMPSKADKLSPEVIVRLEAWIDDGAPYDAPLIAGKLAKDKSKVTEEDRKWWAFQPLLKTSVQSSVFSVQSGPRSPNAKLNTEHLSPIDRFLLAKAAPRTFAPIADKRTLIRRAHLDLHGIPPTPEAVDDFIKDTSPDAWTKLIASLLDSPRYGERWARHWLDVARFAESSGFEHDYDRPGAFHFRDFVIKALNSDMPFDQFLRWQLAGDEFEPGNPLALSATGFLGAGVFPTQITANEVERTRYDAMDDMLSTTGSAFLGLTIGCARCHDHKYDPLPTEDYYRMLATFTTTVRSVVDLEMEPEKSRDAKAKWQAEAAPLAAELKRHEAALATKFDAWLASGAAMPTGGVWNVVELASTKSKAGTTFKKLDDLSYLAEGANGASDEYTFTFTTQQRRLTGLRLEALAHASMTKSGPGRADNGNFALSKIIVGAAPKGSAEAKPVAIAKAVADFEQNKASLSIASSLDNDPKSGWAVDPQFGKDHAAVFTFAEPVDFEGGATFTVRLQFEVNGKHNIGRPRLALMADAEPTLKGEDLPAKVAEVLRNAKQPDFAAKLSTAERETLLAWWLRKDAGWRDRQAKVTAHASREPGTKTQVLVCAEGNKPLRMHTQGADFFEQTHFLRRGSTDQKLGVAPQGFLQVLTRAADADKRWQWQPTAGAKFSGRRRSLANWLTDVDSGAGALVARVAVNRLWQHHFGRGLVVTPDDFGRTGALPSHPELLDWLAGELIKGGWMLKPIHRLIMESEAYRAGSVQSAKVAAGRSEKTPSVNTDSLNTEHFLHRQPRRLEGEALRDAMLAVSGQLDTTMFGPGTKDERSKRRSIYFTMKRSQLIGSMVVFDQPEPLVSQGARPTTTVAPQALLLMNGPQVREWAEAFARRVESDAPGTETPAKVNRAYLLALSRPATAKEQGSAATFLASQTASYEAEKKPNARQLALADFCQVLFGLNEFAYEN
jgi:mono/diheme cytochrome c family protein